MKTNLSLSDLIVKLQAAAALVDSEECHPEVALPAAAPTGPTFINKVTLHRDRVILEFGE